VGNKKRIYSPFYSVQVLVGGAITILKNMSSSMGRIIPYIMENNKCSKPPTGVFM